MRLCADDCGEEVAERIGLVSKHKPTQNFLGTNAKKKSVGVCSWVSGSHSLYKSGTPHTVRRAPSARGTRAVTSSATMSGAAAPGSRPREGHVAFGGEKSNVPTKGAERRPSLSRCPTARGNVGSIRQLQTLEADFRVLITKVRARLRLRSLKPRRSPVPALNFPLPP